jgi:diadenylate cyclase
MTGGKSATNGSAAQQRPSLREAVARLAPGTALRDGLERILRGRTGALIVLGYDDSVEAICDGGFSLDVRYAPTRLRELCKMDGAVVLSVDGDPTAQVCGGRGWLRCRQEHPDEGAQRTATSG